MMCDGTLIQIRRCGTTKRIETLLIGDLVYDPIADNYQEILDILTRQHDGPPGLLYTIAAGSLMQGRPTADLTVTRQQRLLAFAENNAARRVQEIAAGDLGRPASAGRRLRLLVLENDAFVMANGACLHVLGQQFVPKAGPLAQRPFLPAALHLALRGHDAK